MVRLPQPITLSEGLGPVTQMDQTAEARRADLEALRAWFDDWTETAKIVITRRDELIRLGLAKRKKANKTAKMAPIAPAPASVPTLP
jgi:hypothetical protein